jgi:hypothetical protein
MRANGKAALYLWQSHSQGTPFRWKSREQFRAPLRGKSLKLAVEAKSTR